MLTRKTVRVVLVTMSILATGLVIGTGNDPGNRTSNQVADRYHARNRTANFFERSNTSAASGVATTRSPDARPVAVPARSMRRR